MKMPIYLNTFSYIYEHLFIIHYELNSDGLNTFVNRNVITKSISFIFWVHLQDL